MKFLLSFFILERLFRPQVVVQMSSKMDSSLLIWGFGIFFSVTFFLSDALTKSQLQQSIKDPFYTSDWRETLRFFIFFLLLIFSIYLTGFNAMNSLNLLFITIVNSITICFLLYIIFVLYAFFYKEKSFDWKSDIRTCLQNFSPLYKDFAWACLASAVFFFFIITLCKQFHKQLLNDDLIYLITFVSLIIIAYSVLIMKGCDLFIKLIKLLHDKEEDGTYWTIFYTDPSQKQSISHIKTKEIIKDFEGYYRISDSNRPGITLMIPISSIVRIDEYKKSSDIKMEDSMESSERTCLKENSMNFDIPTESKKKDKGDQKKNNK